METHYFYVYGIVPKAELEKTGLPEMSGIDQSELEEMTYHDISAIYTQVRKEEYTEEELDKKTNDLKWLQEKAVHHNEILSALHSSYTTLPLKFCTLYTTLSSLEEVLAEHEDQIRSIHESIKGKDEWNLKIYADDSAWEAMIKERHPEIEQQYKDLESLPPGKRFFEKKKIEKAVKEAIEAEKAKICQQIHLNVSEISDKHKEKELLSKQATGRSEDMVWNGSYLISRQAAQGIDQLLEQWQTTYKVLGVYPECTGPWPVYQFAKLGEAKLS